MGCRGETLMHSCEDKDGDEVGRRRVHEWEVDECWSCDRWA